MGAALLVPWPRAGVDRDAVSAVEQDAGRDGATGLILTIHTERCDLKRRKTEEGLPLL